jgi:hypothetical protein
MFQNRPILQRRAGQTRNFPGLIGPHVRDKSAGTQLKAAILNTNSRRRGPILLHLILPDSTFMECLFGFLSRSLAECA